MDYDSRDIPHFYDMISKPDMIELINLVISFGHATYVKNIEIHEASLKLRDSIQAYLQDGIEW